MEEIVKTTKICTKCGEEKNVSEFGKRKNVKDGLRSNCKTCERKYSKIYHYKKQENIKKEKEIYYIEHKDEIENNKKNEAFKIENIKNNITHKICVCCQLDKNITEFTKSKKHKYGYLNKCKTCNKLNKKNTEKQKEYRKRNRNKINERKLKYYYKNKENILKKQKLKRLENPEFYLEKRKLREGVNKAKPKIIKTEKTCAICNATLPIQNFNKSTNSSDGYKYLCRECSKKQIKEWRKNNPTYELNKRKTDVLYKLKQNVRHRINSYMKNVGLRKSTKSFNTVGCSSDFLKTYIENLFIENMSWDNYGVNGWHIDHIIPLSSAKTEGEIIKLCHYTNLQPLWAKDNLQKGDKIS